MQKNWFFEITYKTTDAPTNVDGITIDNFCLLYYISQTDYNLHNLCQVMYRRRRQNVVTSSANTQLKTNSGFPTLKVVCSIQLAVVINSFRFWFTELNQNECTLLSN